MRIGPGPPDNDTEDPPDTRWANERRITTEHRLIYKIFADEVRIAACRYHHEG